VGHNPQQHPIDKRRREAAERPDARPQDPRTNTRPRGNGLLDSGEKERSAAKLAVVLGH